MLWATIEALDEVLPDIGFPIDNEFELQEMSYSFSRKNNGILDGLVMVIDGLIVRTRCPYNYEVSDPKSYQHRKGGFGIIVMAGCDGNAKFRSITAKHTGSTNDNVAWESSALAAALENGQLHPRYFIGGDEAFVCTDYLLSPWHGRGIGQWRDSFNYWLSHSRQCIERAFGMLVARWGIYWRRFRFSYDRWSLVIILTAKLHNICVDRRQEVPTRRYHEDIPEEGCLEILDNTREDDINLYRKRSCSRRQQITSQLEATGSSRPTHAIVNSRR